MTVRLHNLDYYTSTTGTIDDILYATHSSSALLTVLLVSVDSSRVLHACTKSNVSNAAPGNESEK